MINSLRSRYQEKRINPNVKSLPEQDSITAIELDGAAVGGASDGKVDEGLMSRPKVEELAFSNSLTFDLLKGLEGFEEEAYLGLIKEGKYKSGLTVGAGIDFGQHSEQSLIDIGISKSLIDKASKAGWLGLNPDTVIDPKTNKPAANRARGKVLLEEKIKEQKKAGTFPKFTKEELDASTPIMYKPYEEAAENQYKQKYNEPEFYTSGKAKRWENLSEATKAILSLEVYHRGVNYTLPEGMLTGAAKDAPYAAANTIKNEKRKKNAIDYLSKYNVSSAPKRSLRPKTRPIRLASN